MKHTRFDQMKLLNSISEQDCRKNLSALNEEIRASELGARIAEYILRLGSDFNNCIVLSHHLEQDSDIVKVLDKSGKVIVMEIGRGGNACYEEVNIISSIKYLKGLSKFFRIEYYVALDILMKKGSG